MGRKDNRQRKCQPPESYGRGSGDTGTGKRKGLSEPPCPVEDCLTLISKKVRKLELHDKQNSSEEAPVDYTENANGLQDDKDSRKDSRPSTSDGEPSAPYGKYDSFSKTPSASYNELKQSVSHQPPRTSIQQPSARYSHYPSTSYNELLPIYKEEYGTDETLCAIYKKQCAIYEGQSVRSSVGCLQLDNASPRSHKKLSFGQIEDEHLCYRLKHLTVDDKREMAAGKKRNFDDFQWDEVSVRIRRLPRESTHGLQAGDQNYGKDSRSDNSDGESSAPYRNYASASFIKTPSASSNEPKQSASNEGPSASHHKPNAGHQQLRVSYSQCPSTSYDERLPSYEDECGNDEELCVIYKKKRTSYEEGPSVRPSVGCVQLLDSASYSAWKSRKKMENDHSEPDSDDTEIYELPPRRRAPHLAGVNENRNTATRRHRKRRRRARRAKRSFSEIQDEHLCYRLENLTLDDKREMAAGKKRKFDDFQQDEVSVKIRRLPREHSKWQSLDAS